MRASIAICTWNRCDLLRQTLEGLTRLSAQDGDWEVVVVNNACTDRTDDVIAEYMHRLPLRRVFESTPGHSNARNRAIQEVKGEWILFTDDDVLVDPEWVTACLATALRCPNAAAIGGPIEPWFPHEPDELLVRVFPALGVGFCGLDHGPNERVLETEDLFGANMAYHVGRIADLRFLEGLGHNKSSDIGGDDTDFVRRVRQNGGEIAWSPRMKVRHYVAPNRMTVSYQAKYLTDWARMELRQSGRCAAPQGPLLAGVPRWLWKSVLGSYVSWQLSRVAAGREKSLNRLKEYSVFKGWLLEWRAVARGTTPQRS